MLSEEGQPFTTGLCKYYDGIEADESGDSKLFIAVKLGTLETPILAMVDTGAPFCIFEPEILAELGYSFEVDRAIRLSTRRGPKLGSPDRIPITFIANEGKSLEVESTVFVTVDWKGNFIGFMGCLQRLRFAIDPSANSFHFGEMPS